MNQAMTLVEAIKMYPEAKRAFGIPSEPGTYYIITGEAEYKRVSGVIGETRSLIPCLKITLGKFCMPTTFPYKIGSEELIDLTLGEVGEVISKSVANLTLTNNITADEKEYLSQLKNQTGFGA